VIVVGAYAGAELTARQLGEGVLAKDAGAAAARNRCA